MPIRIRRRAFMFLAAATPFAACNHRATPTTPSAAPVAAIPTSGPSLDSPPPLDAPIAPAIALPTVRADVVDSELVVTVTNTALQSVGGMARTEGSVGEWHRYVLLARRNAEQLVALNGICTHEGCVITRFASPVFECPCHGSHTIRPATCGAALRLPRCRS